MHSQPSLSSRFRWSRWWCCSRFSRWWWWWCCLQRCNFIVRRKNATKSIRTTLICHLTRYLDNFDICIQLRRGGMRMGRVELSTVANNNDNLRQGHQSSQTGMQLAVWTAKKKQKEKEKQIKVGKGKTITFVGFLRFFGGLMQLIVERTLYIN